MVSEVSYDTDSSSYPVDNVVYCVSSYPVDNVVYCVSSYPVASEVSYYTDS